MKINDFGMALSARIARLIAYADKPTYEKRASYDWSGVDRTMAVCACLILSMMVLLSPEIAMAQNAVETLDPLEQILQSVIGIMTGPIATGVAIIAVAAVGYMSMTGRMEMLRALQIIIGMIIVFGSANIVNALRGSTSFTGAGSIGG